MSPRSNRDGQNDGRPGDGSARTPRSHATIIARARKLLADPNYPTDMIVAEIARMIALEEAEDRDEEN